ncbi:unnamed protein product [Blepharisma stoltei]|uniref:Uncharacterized protein n=1 Tax=Blepharisma stoltei TaxID=1481888 RepID=A0AAU9K623_9CILI|nr:unnamed protein product [Blepharisma stoltei]
MKERKFSRQNLSDTSILSVAKSLIEEIQNNKNSPQALLKEQYFIPFINERDGCGRLRKFLDPPPKRERPPIKPTNTNQSQIFSRKKLISKHTKISSVPPVGIYYQPESWIKQSFSHKPLLQVSLTSPKLNLFSATMENTSIDSNLRPSKSFAVSKSFPNIKKTKNTQKQTFRSRPARKKGVWECLQIQTQIDDLRDQPNEPSYTLPYHERILSILRDMRKNS